MSNRGVPYITPHFLGNDLPSTFERAGPPGPEIPFIDNLEHHYDYTDLSTLWLDEFLSVPLVGPNQAIRGMTDKGSGALDIFRVAASVHTRLWDNYTYAFPTAQGDGDIAARGGCSAVYTGSFAPPQTFFVVYRMDTNFSGSPFNTNASTGFQFTTDVGAGMTFNYSGETGLASAVNDTADVWHACIVICRADSTQSLYHSLDSTTRTDTYGAITINTGSMSVGEFSLGSSPHEGPIAEVGAYNIDDGDEATLVADFKTWVTAKYGITWA